MLKAKETAPKHYTLFDKAVAQIYELTMGYELKSGNSYTHILEFDS